MENLPQESRNEKPIPNNINHSELELQQEMITKMQRESQIMVRIIFGILIGIILIFSVGINVTYTKMIAFQNGIEVVCDCQTYNHTYNFISLIIIGCIICTLTIVLLIIYHRKNIEYMKIYSEVSNNIKIYEDLINKINQLKGSESNAVNK